MGGACYPQMVDLLLGLALQFADPERPNKKKHMPYRSLKVRVGKFWAHQLLESIILNGYIMIHHVISLVNSPRNHHFWVFKTHHMQQNAPQGASDLEDSDGGSNRLGEQSPRESGSP